MKVTLATEAYNLDEGQSETAFLGALSAVDSIARRYECVEAYVMDPTTTPQVARILDTFPRLKRFPYPGAAYEVQKNAICREAEGSDYVVFLDGDCRPVHEDWLDRILSPFASAATCAVSGLTLYDDDSNVGKAMTTLDFGFLFESDGAVLDCYVSNNVAFRRDVLLDCPIPEEGVLRSYCYKHAQLLKRSGRGVRLCQSALMLHELPNVEKERLRRGYDYVSALWADPELHEAQWLQQEPPEQFLEHILQHNLEWANRRLQRAPEALDVVDSAEVSRQFSELMQFDRTGVIQALKEMGKL